MKVHLYQERCVSSGQCVSAAPDVFDQRDDDGVAFLLTDSPSLDMASGVRQAARVCPALAITVDESSAD
ncbi:ferredoxin [Rhodococcus sp. NPDC059968]|uniref:ferredoxin n=1 Tax=Rhodococcus sp. NPDC059968 TaxID=3347017 RepID=UPI00366E59AF